MPLYTFYLRSLDGISTGRSAYELADDGASLREAAELLNEHLHCDHVDVWKGEGPIVAFHRFQPALRPVSEKAP